jgi:CRISPR/Cas system-associated exonuclease Cas4 (RecB family)
MRIRYHAWKAYKECPKKFFLEYIKKAPPSVPDNDYHKLYGLLVQKFFEFFCNTWRFKTPYMPPEIIHERMLVLWDAILKSSEVCWTAPFVSMTQQELFEKAWTDVCAIMDSLNQNYFLNSKSEVSIELKLKDEHVITGRLDFVHTDYLAGNAVVIFDGKGTGKIGKNIDNNQLLFYALLYFFSTKVLPSSLGFFYYQLNTFVPIFFDKSVLDEFRARLSLDIKEMTTVAEYLPTPCAKSCKYCRYLVGCQEGTMAKAGRAKKSKLPELEGDGIVEFGL